MGLHAGADLELAFLEVADPADVDADAGVELQRAAAGRGLGVAEHHADLLADLVDEHEAGLRLGDTGGQLAQGLAHEARLEADVGVAHLAFKLGLGYQGGDGVDDDYVEAGGADHHVGDLEGLLAAVGLVEQQFVEVYPQLLGVGGVHRVLGVDEEGGAAGLLGVGDDGEAEGGLARAFRAEDFDDAAAGESFPAEGQVEAEGAGRDPLNVHLGVAAEPGELAGPAAEHPVVAAGVPPPDPLRVGGDQHRVEVLAQRIVIDVQRPLRPGRRELLRGDEHLLVAGRRVVPDDVRAAFHLLRGLGGAGGRECAARVRLRTRCRGHCAGSGSARRHHVAGPRSRVGA